jgi:hypothetical protein
MRNAQGSEQWKKTIDIRDKLHVYSEDHHDECLRVLTLEQVDVFSNKLSSQNWTRSASMTQSFSQHGSGMYMEEIDLSETSKTSCMMKSTCVFHFYKFSDRH